MRHSDAHLECICQALELNASPSLRNNAKNWELLAPSALTTFHTGILELGLDITLYFKKNHSGQVVWPKQTYQQKQSLFYMQNKSEKFVKAVQEMIDNGIAREMPFDGFNEYFFHHLFPVDKPDGTVRPVGNYQPLNMYIHCDHFKMENTKVVRDLMRPGDWMCSWDLEKCYFQIDMAANSRKFTCFFFQDKIYAMWQCDFGINILPRVCTKMMKPFLSHIRAPPHNIRCVSYLDDGQTYSESKQLALRDAAVIRRVLQLFGWKVNTKKSDWKPLQCREFLGNLSDSVRMEIRLPERKIVGMRAEIKTLLSAEDVTLRHVMSVHGTLGAGYESIGMIGYRLLETKFLIADCVRKCQDNFDAKIALTPEVVAELTTFSKFLRLWNGSAVNVGEISMCIATDASNIGWGAVVLYGKRALDQLSLAAHWNRETSLWHINRKEMFAVTHGARQLIEMNGIFGVHILFQVDSTTVLAYLRHRSKGNRVLARMMGEFLTYLERRKITASTCWVASEDNKEADDLSRDVRLDHADWQLNSEVFSDIRSFYGGLQIDLFATYENTQLPRFVSWKPDERAEWVDALRKDVKWSQFYFYANPPFILLAKVMNKIKADAATGVVIVPLWPTAPWFPLFLDLLVETPLLLPRRRDLLTKPTVSAHLPAWETMAALLSNSSSLHTECDRPTRDSSKPVWPPKRLLDTTRRSRR